MISEDNDEDADSFDNDSAIGAGPVTDTCVYPAIWPPLPDRMSGTIAWFKANTGDWSREIDAILRGWIASR